MTLATEHRIRCEVMAKASAISIRKAKLGDADGILTCLREAFEPYRELYTREGFLDTVLTTETIRNRISMMTIIVAINSVSEIIGTVACSVVAPEEGHLRGMAVRPAWHGHGIARQLLDAAEAELHQHNCRRVTLDTTEPLKRAIRFYERNGFRATGKVGDFFGMPLLEYEKSLQ
jgi:ribosomal protein S18 acetylase RimI-like enzyme